MTEKEFLLKLQSTEIETIGDICKEALQLAKEHGAEFDPEPEWIDDLPKLRIFKLVNSPGIFKFYNDGTRGTCYLSYTQAEEVLYRCRRWNLMSPEMS